MWGLKSCLKCHLAEAYFQVQRNLTFVRTRNTKRMHSVQLIVVVVVMGSPVESSVTPGSNLRHTILVWCLD